MILTQLHWVPGPWPGKLALSARPRGGDWLDDEAAAWRTSRIDLVVSLLEPHEEIDLDLTHEAEAVAAHGMTFVSLPIPDRDVPASATHFAKQAESLEAKLARGNNILIHCRQGVGRTGLLAASLLVLQGTSPGEAMRRLTHARGIEVPETESQRIWIERFAQAHTHAA